MQCWMWGQLSLREIHLGTVDAPCYHARRHSDLTIVAGGLVFTCDSGGDKEGHSNVAEGEHGYCCSHSVGLVDRICRWIDVD
jgi:hypothetical protein